MEDAVSPIREMILTLIRGDNVTADEISDHIARLKRLGATLPEGWKHTPSEIRAMEREGILKREGEGWLTIVQPDAKPKAKQEMLF